MSSLGTQSSSEQRPPEIGQWPPSSPFLTGGFLSNAGVQFASGGTRFDIELYGFVQLKKHFAAASAGTKLRVLKEQHFTADGRNRRIEKSLRALHGQQLFVRPFHEWRWAVEDVEAEEQE